MAAMVSRALALVALFAGGSLATACGAGSAEAPAVEASMVNATSIVSACPDAAKMNARAAQEAIRKLVGPCAKVPGGKAAFSATLVPGGRIELASPSGDAAEGVVPTCVLKNRLVHNVLLKQPCTFRVELEERKVGDGK